MSGRIGIAAMIWSATILLSRVIGLVREAVFGRVVGGGRAADVYWAAFTLPDFLNYLLAAGALSIVFIPIFARHLARDDEAAAWRSLRVISTFLGVLLSVGLIGMWYAVPAFSAWWFAGFDAAQQAELVTLTRIILPAQAFHVLGGLMSAALMARDRHALPAIAPLVYTGCIIAGGLLGGSGAGARGFAWGVVVGSALGPFLLPLVGCLRMGMRWWPEVSLRDPDLRVYLWRTAPVMLAFSVIMLDDWFWKHFAADLETGAVSTLQYAKTLMKVPMGVFGIAVGTAAFPTLSRMIAEGQGAQAYQTLSTAVRRMLVLAVACQVGMSAAGSELAEVIYGQRLLPGQHDAIGLALVIMSLGLWAWAAQTVVARGFYAHGKTWLPSLVGSLVAAAFFPLYGLLAERLGTAGLALASTLAITTFVVALIVLLRREHPGVPDGYGGYALRMIPSAAVGLGAALALDRWVSLRGLPGMDGTLGALIQGGLTGSAAMAIFFGATWLFAVGETREIIALVQRKLARRRG